MATTSKNGILYVTDGTDRVNWYPVTLAGNVQTTGGSDVETQLAAKYVKPSGGIPSSDLASAVQTSLGKADTAYQKPSGGVPSTDMTSAVQTSLGKADTALQASDITGKEDKTTKVNKTSSDTSQTLAENTFYVWPEMSALTITCPNTGGPYAFRFQSGSTPTTLTMTGITMPDSWAVEANKVYEINVYQGYGVAASWGVSS